MSIGSIKEVTSLPLSGSPMSDRVSEVAAKIKKKREEQRAREQYHQQSSKKNAAEAETLQNELNAKLANHSTLADVVGVAYDVFPMHVYGVYQLEMNKGKEYITQSDLFLIHPQALPACAFLVFGGQIHNQRGLCFYAAAGEVKTRLVALAPSELILDYANLQDITLDHSHFIGPVLRNFLSEKGIHFVFTGNENEGVHSIASRLHTDDYTIGNINPPLTAAIYSALSGGIIVMSTDGVRHFNALMSELYPAPYVEKQMKFFSIKKT